jgi:hypothetical protein
VSALGGIQGAIQPFTQGDSNQLLGLLTTDLLSWLENSQQPGKLDEIPQRAPPALPRMTLEQTKMHPFYLLLGNKPDQASKVLYFLIEIVGMEKTRFLQRSVISWLNMCGHVWQDNGISPREDPSLSTAPKPRARHFQRQYQWSAFGVRPLRRSSSSGHHIRFDEGKYRLGTVANQTSLATSHKASPGTATKTALHLLREMSAAG